jgi:lipoyl(octanoyl) transferase
MNRAEPSSPELWVCHLGAVPYRDALALQARVRERRLAEELPDTLLLLEHPPVYTRGRRSAANELILGEEFYRERGIEVVDTDRGGRVTYHGPGQLVGYPIMRIHDIGAHLLAMESAIVAALADEGIEARSRRAEGPDYTGVWVQDRKIASIGVHVSRGISTHGFAVNVDLDLDPFSWIVACGLPGVTMTSIAREPPSDRTIDPDGVRARVAHHFCDAHGLRPRLVSPHQLGIDAAPHAGIVAPFGPPTLDTWPPPARVRGRTPRADARRTATACADATLASPTPDTATLITGHGAPV